MGDRTQTNAQRNGTGSGTKKTPNTEPENSRNKWVFATFCNNWVGKSSDFTNPFVCGPAGGKVKKMSSSSSVCHICRQQYTYHILVIFEPVQGG